MDWVSMIVGASLYIGGMLTGFVMVGRRRVGGESTEQYVCGCGHNLALHDPKTGGCHAENVRSVYDDGEWIGEKPVRCACRQYVGPESVERVIGSFQLPESEPDRKP